MTNQVATEIIADGAITAAKLASGVAASNIGTGGVSTTMLADAGVTPAKLSQPLTRGTSIGSTSGSFIDFPIPSWAKRITVMFQGVSLAGTSQPRIRLGTGGTPATSGYVGVTGGLITGTAAASLSAGFDVSSSWASASNVFSGTAEFCLVAPDTWVCSSTLASTGGGTVGLNLISGYVSLAGTLNTVRVTSVSGSDTFDAGSINVLYD